MCSKQQNEKNNELLSIRMLLFILITLIVIMVRLWISFSQNLIIGMDGGYYPVQVRSIFKTGHLAFSDVPLYFYFCFFCIKIASFFGLVINDENIIRVIKIIDSMALPLLAIPLFKILSIKGKQIPLIAAIAILLFAICSFSPFIMLGDIQKNAFAIPILFWFIYYLDKYLIDDNKRDLLVALILLLVIALTHFGVFAFGIAILIITIFLVYRGKAILPSLGVCIISIFIISIFDSNRAFRLLTFWEEIFVVRPFEMHDPMLLPLLLNTIFSYALAIFGIIQYRKFKNDLEYATKSLLLILLTLIFIFGFPLFEIHYVQRFNVLLFIPQSLLIVILIRINKKKTIPISIFLLIITVIFSSIYFKHDKKAIMGDLAYRDFQNIKKHIPVNSDSTIIITRHGVEFWTAWALNVKVGNDRSLDKLKLDNYNNVFLLQPKNEFGNRPHKPNPFHDQEISKKSQLIYSSLYFNMFRLEK
jgi:hypothetical protein